MTSESNRIGSLGVNYVTGVLLRWGWGYQSISQENDDGFDGIIYIKSKHSAPKVPENKSKLSWDFTGGLIHVQVKSGDGYVSSRNKSEIKLKIKNLDKKKEIWGKSPIPCILIFFYEDDSGVAHSYWADLKSELTYIDGSNSLIKVPLKNRFARSQECKGPLRRLARISNNYANKPLINLSKSDSLNGILPISLNRNLNYPLKNKAIDFYQNWKSIGATNPQFGPVIINRTGWSHITRKGRPIARIEASFNLLPIAARIINDVSTWRMLTPMRRYENRKDGHICITDFIGLTARVILNNRNSSEVMVVLKRETKLNESKGKTATETRLWFYTVYEPGRGK
ncbi:DUF4365 domain-containing protein [Serratia marcescens]|uniref:DUF4365 domain-containing protein n=1 Tax=Serratia nevei TaxID=2703794 RepID=UPI0018D6773C|nr:DUF4365 domain-containing protein [Serratia marcescens]MBH2807914.1 DUF4365 domain-containing protein [Serratia marcescens]MBN5235651.1 DUF4365 domain-containing protein [Serratia marcescens]